MDYFGGGPGAAGAIDPYAVIPQQFGNGGLPPPQAQHVDAPDYETFQAQQAAQFRAAQAQAQAQAAAQQQQQQQQQPQPSPSMYYQAAAAPGSYFPIHSATENDFLGPQHPPPSGAQQPAGGGGGAPYQHAAAGGNKDFIMQHQQRRGGGNQSGQQQGQSSSQQQQQQRQMGGASNQHFMHHQMQAVQQQQQAQQQMHHRLQGAPINPQQFMVPPPNMIQTQQMQQNQQQMHHLQMQMMQQQQQQQNQPQGQQSYHQHHPQQQQQHHQGGGGGGGHHHHGQQHQQHHQHHNQQQQQHNHNNHHHNQNQQQQGHHSNQNHNQGHMPPQHMIQRAHMPLRDWPIRCVIESRYYSVIIGPGGATIREIAQSTHCRVEFVNLSKRERAVIGNNERILTIHGHAEQASKAIARILDVIQVEALKDDANVGVDIVLRLRAHNQLCGRLIGKQGASIKETMQKTGTNITVAKYVEPPGGFVGLRPEEILSLMERTIVVRGPSIEAVVQAESLISAKLKKCYEHDTQLRAQAMTSAPVMAPIPLLPPAQPGSNGVTLPSLIPTANGLIQVQHFQPTSFQSPNASNSFLQPGMIQISPGVTSMRQLIIWVPDNLIGALIGTKGKNIKQIIRETEAVVRIESAEEKAEREAEEEEKRRARGAEAPVGEAADRAAAGDAAGVEEHDERARVVERRVKITGDDLQILKAQSFIFAKMSEIVQQPQNVSDNERIIALKFRTEMTVPTKIIGRIIGKGGQNVRELQRITGASVKIPEELRNGGEVFVHPDGLEEDLTIVRSYGNMHSTHNVHFRLAHLIGEYYRSGEHRQQSSANRGTSSAAGGRASGDGSPLNNMGQLGQVPPISTSTTRNTPSSGSAKSKSP